MPYEEFLFKLGLTESSMSATLYELYNYIKEHERVATKDKDYELEKQLSERSDQ